MSQSAQQPLELPPLVLITLVLVASLAAWNLGQPQANPSISRHQEETLTCSSLGIHLALDRGWTLLITEQVDRASRLTLVNEVERLIVQLKQFPFQSWPLTKEELVASGMRLTTLTPNEVDASPAEVPVVSKPYRGVTVQWLEIDTRDTPGSAFSYGRIQQQQVDLLMTVISSSETPVSQSALRSLCDSIEIIPEA
ncbi:MAG: hypothetical protein MI861_09250 [Pirellulales bacterium]|nr:hypothetical protein [Pirellulales bacterium]